MSFFDDVERRLREETPERYGRRLREEAAPTRRHGRASFVRRHRRVLLVAAAALAGLTVPALGAVSGLWQPDVRPSPPMRTTAGTGFSCSQEPSGSIDAGPRVGPVFTSVLAVLARPRTTADVLDRRYLRVPFAHDIDVHGIRYLGTAPDGRRYYVIPAGGSGSSRPADDCLRKLPSKIRRADARSPRHEPTICVVGGGAGGCGPLADVRSHGSWSASGIGNHSTVAGVVPDGVRAIRVTYGRSTRSFPVEGNFFAFRVALQAPQAASPDRLEWELADGSLRDVTRRSGASVRRDP
ncbi:MAG: hypothetical protein ACTHOE_14455 [Conexibacter sp.]